MRLATPAINAEEQAEFKQILSLLAMSVAERDQYLRALASESLAGLAADMQDFAAALKSTPGGRIRVTQRIDARTGPTARILTLAEALGQFATAASTANARRNAAQASRARPAAFYGGAGGSKPTDLYKQPGTVIDDMRALGCMMNDPARVVDGLSGMGSWLSSAFRSMTGVRLSQVTGSLIAPALSMASGGITSLLPGSTGLILGGAVQTGADLINQAARIAGQQGAPATIVSQAPPSSPLPASTAAKLNPALLLGGAAALLFLAKRR